MHTVMHVSVKMCDACQLLWLDVSFNELEELNLEELLCCPVRNNHHLFGVAAVQNRAAASCRTSQCSTCF